MKRDSAPPIALARISFLRTCGLPFSIGEAALAAIQGYIGPDHKVIDMKAFFAALVQALKEAARERSARR